MSFGLDLLNGLRNVGGERLAPNSRVMLLASSLASMTRGQDECLSVAIGCSGLSPKERIESRDQPSGDVKTQYIVGGALG
jgi:hypothetical protein